MELENKVELKEFYKMVGSLSPDQINDYSARTNLPAMKNALYLVAHADKLKEAWQDKYVNCSWWAPMFNS